MCNDNGWLRVLYCSLRSDSAGPKYRYFSLPNFDRIAVVWLHHILNAYLLRITDLDRSTVNIRHFYCNVVGYFGLFRGHRAHGAHHGSFKRSRLYSLNIGLVHRHIAALLNMTHGEARGHERLLKGKGAPD